MQTIIVKIKTSAVLTNRRAFLVLRNTEKNLKTIAKKMASAINHVEFSAKISLFLLQLLIVQSSTMIQIAGN